MDDPDNRSADDDLPRMTLAEHLRELRGRLLRAVLALVVCLFASLFVWKPIWDFAKGPFEVAARRQGMADATLQAVDPGEGFVQVMKLCFLTAIVVSSPYVLWQMWGFIAAGLYRHERRVVRLFFPVSVGLFLLGVLAAYLLMIPFALAFLIGFDVQAGMTPQFRVEAYLSLCLTMVFAMGLCFELPLVMLFLQATGLVERPTFQKGWRMAVLLSFAVAMVVTPDPSPTSMLILAFPLVGLYFLGVWGGRFVGEKRAPFKAWMAWPLVLAAAVFVGLLLHSSELADWAAGLFGGPSPSAVPVPAPAPAGAPR